VVIDVAVYEDHAVLDLFYLEKLRNLDKNHLMTPARPRRFVLEDIHHAQGTLREAKVKYTMPTPIDLPTVHPALYHKPYRFA
jgi:torulene dioxygenase